MTFGPVPNGWDLLGSTVMSAAAASSAVVAIEPRDILQVQVRVTGYGSSDIASLRFNGDTGANYTSHYVSAAPPATGTTPTFVDVRNTAAALARLFANGVAAIGRTSLVNIDNLLGVSKQVAPSSLTGSGSAATAPTIELGGAEWVNTTAQITSIQLVTAGGATLLTGTGFRVLGANL